MQVKKTGIPGQSLLGQHLPADYSDAFACVFSPDRAIITPDDLMSAFWTKFPPWVGCLFYLRNALVKPFGLQGGGGEFKASAEEVIRSGGGSDLLRVVAKTADETAIVLDDKHLAAYVSVLLEDAGAGRVRAVCCTVVHFHNRLGRVYFALIKPFHGLVVRAMLKNTVKKLTK